MTTTTNNLRLFKYDTTTDVNVAFNLNLSLNDNWDKIDTAFGNMNNTINQKQDKLVSGTNIKTINGSSILGNGSLSTFPSQSGKEGLFLYTNGYSTSWETAIPIGTVLWYVGNTAPQNFYKCDGSSLPVNSHNALYLVIGTKYGGSAGSYFNLPNIMSKFIEGGTISNISSSNYKSAGLPNIKGGGFASPNGTAPAPFYKSGSIGGAKGGTSGSDAKIFFDASLVNRIYGNSTTVQPPAVILTPIIKYR